MNTRTRLRVLLLPLLLLVVAFISAPPFVQEAAAAACHSGGPCPNPTSCGGWSTLVACDSPFCDSHPSCDFKSGGVATVQLKERFRACTLADGSQCLEWQLYSYLVHCGC
jgi:hypothetical protein